MGRVLGVDYGMRRVGIAVSDSLGVVATPTCKLEVQSLTDAVRQTAELVVEKNVDKVVVGLPLHMNGSKGELAETAEKFASKLASHSGVEVVTWDERLTSAEAERVLLQADTSRKKRKQVIDKMAAQIMLQSYLDAHAF